RLLPPRPQSTAQDLPGFLPGARRGTGQLSRPKRHQLTLLCMTGWKSQCLEHKSSWILALSLSLATSATLAPKAAATLGWAGQYQLNAVWLWILPAIHAVHHRGYCP